MLDEEINSVKNGLNIAIQIYEVLRCIYDCKKNFSYRYIFYSYSYVFKIFASNIFCCGRFNY